MFQRLRRLWQEPTFFTLASLVLVLVTTVTLTLQIAVWRAPTPLSDSDALVAVQLPTPTDEPTAEPLPSPVSEAPSPTASPTLDTAFAPADSDDLRQAVAVERRALLTANAPPSAVSLDVPGAEAPTDPTPPLQAQLASVGEVWQTLNNCGPASVSMVLAYFGRHVTQVEAEKILRPDPEIWGMLPNAVPPYVAAFGLGARVLDHGSADVLKTLLRQGIPVIVAQWLSEDQKLPHYRVVTGYDDEKESFLVNDGVLGFGHAIAYADFDKLWDVYTNLYIPVFKKDDQEQVRASLADQWDHTVTFLAAVPLPDWALQLRAGSAAAPTETPDAEPTAEPTVELKPNTSPETAWPLVVAEEQTGTLKGSTGGSFVFYTVKSADKAVVLRFHGTPDDPGASKGIGVKVYRADGKLAAEGFNETGKIGERVVRLPASDNAYLVQVYNYLPNAELTFSLTWEK